MAVSDGRLMAQFLIMTIQVNLVPNPSENWRRQHKFTWIVVIKNFTISHSHFLAATLDFTSFFTMAFLGPHTFLLLGCFRIDKYIQACCSTNSFALLSALFHSSVIIMIMYSLNTWNLQILWQLIHLGQLTVYISKGQLQRATRLDQKIEIS